MYACATKDDMPYRCHGTKGSDNGEDRFSGVCDKNGCDIHAWRFGVRDFYGPGDKFKVNSAKPVSITIQFLTDDDTDSGTVNKFKQFHTQNGKTVEHPRCTVNGKPHKTISDEMCADWVAETKDGTNFLAMGGMGAVDTVFKNGAVLVVCLSFSCSLSPCDVSWHGYSVLIHVGDFSLTPFHLDCVRSSHSLLRTAHDLIHGHFSRFLFLVF